jgi:hypothetical protein
VRSGDNPAVANVDGTLARVHRRALGFLFLALAAGFALIAVFSALEGGRALVIAVAAAALAAWMGGLAYRAFG